MSVTKVLMFPAQWESGSLTRFAALPRASHSMVDGGMDAALVTDRQREGGGPAWSRRPAHESRWTALMARVRAVLSPRKTSPPVVPVAVPVAITPRGV